MSTVHQFIPLEFPGSVWSDPPDPELSWFVVVCNPKCERKAALGLQRKGLAAYLPITIRAVTIRGKRGVTGTPLFPRYLFVGFEGQPRFWDLRSVDGVESIVRIDGEPIRLRSETLMAIADAEKDGAFDQTVKRAAVAAFAKGQSVEITKGPFASFIGTVARCAPDERVTVLLSMMGRASKVKVEAADLRAV